MAYIFPSDIKKQEFSSFSNPELDTLSHLKKHLPDDYTVFHGVHWSREYESQGKRIKIIFQITA